MQKNGVYLDHNATTPTAPAVVSKLSEWAAAFGNPSSIHWAGRPSKLLLRETRRAIANLLHCDPLELIFTAGGSEANNAALQGVFTAIETGWSWAGAVSNRRNELIISAIEHPSVMATAEFLRRKGVIVHVVPVDADRGLRMDVYERLLSERTALVSMMFANNETGYQLPIRELVDLAHKNGALFHCDAVQGLGKAKMDLRALGVDFASFSGHKFYALKGVGVLYVRRGLALESLIHGGGQERGRRAGTENVLGIASLGQMAMASRELDSHIAKMTSLRDELERRILVRLAGVRVIGKNLPRVCNTSSLVIDNVDGEMLLMNLDVLGFAVSTGAACSSGNPEPSPVLLAMGLSRAEAQSSLRISLGWSNTEAEMEQFCDALETVVQRLRTLQPEAVHV